MNRKIVIGLFAILLVVLPILISSTTSEPRYLLPLLPCLLVLTSATFEAVGFIFYGAVSRAILIALVGLAAIGSSAEIIQGERLLRQPDDLMEAVARVPQFPKDTTIYVPEEVITSMRLHPSSATLNRIIDEHRSAWQDDEGTINFLKAKSSNKGR